MSVLDIGCGPGNATRLLANHGLQATGIDVSPEAIREAVRRAGDARGITYRVVDVTRPAEFGTKFDALVDTGCLHYLEPVLWPGYRENVLRASRRGTRFVMEMSCVYLSFLDWSREIGRLFDPEFEFVLAEERDAETAGAGSAPRAVFRLVRR